MSRTWWSARSCRSTSSVNRGRYPWTSPTAPSTQLSAPNSAIGSRRTCRPRSVCRRCRRPARGARPRDTGKTHCVAEENACRRVGRHLVAEGIWRPRRRLYGAGHLRRGVFSCPCAGSADLRPCQPATVFDFPSRLARGRAHASREGKCWRFYPPADPLQAALRLAPLIIPMIDLIQSARGYSKRPQRPG
jgi:hypothetical protein